MKRIILLMAMLVSIEARAQITHVTLTYYHPVKEQTNHDPEHMADNSKIDMRKLKNGKLKWCAISRDLLYMFPKNKPKKIWIEGFGYYEVHDVMNKRYKHSVDILVHPKHSVKSKLKHVKIRIIK